MSTTIVVVDDRVEWSRVEASADDRLISPPGIIWSCHSYMSIRDAMSVQNRSRTCVVVVYVVYYITLE